MDINGIVKQRKLQSQISEKNRQQKEVNAAQKRKEWISAKEEEF